MKVKHTGSQIVHFLETDEKDWNQYTRYSEQSWYVRMGDSDEPIGGTKKAAKLEEAFQKLVRGRK